jgi:hypothetical protein
LKLKKSTLIRLCIAICFLLIAKTECIHAQSNKKALKATKSTIVMSDSINTKKDVVSESKSKLVYEDSAKFSKCDTLNIKSSKRDWATWRPSPQRALWLAIVLPGAGQIYNRKYWKLPIIYGGFIGCIYAMKWNNQMYKDYSQAYLDIMDDDPTTQSYNTFLHLGTTITSENLERYKSLFKSRKDYYRRYRDLSFFCLIGVYALSVIDAYVDAELSVFDISKDLSMKIKPTTINNQQSRNPLNSTAIGLQCCLNF